MENTDHVLIVDDDRGIRELLAGYLEKNGMRVSLAANGRQMRAVLEQGAPDLIVLDLMLPGEDGLVLCRELRAGKFRSVPVLMLTARSEETDRIVGLEMGADDYLAHVATRHAGDGNRVDDRLRRLAARYHGAPPARRRGHHGGAERRGVPPAARVP
jgi:CheY-like chemotaxis protein